jgi:hypothetical protein
MSVLQTFTGMQSQSNLRKVLPYFLQNLPKIIHQFRKHTLPTTQLHKTGLSQHTAAGA